MNLVRNNLEKLNKFFENEKIYDHYDEDCEEDTFLLFLLSTDKFNDKKNHYLRLFSSNIEDPDTIHVDAIFIKVNKKALKELLIDREHVKSLLNRYKDKLVQIGNLKTGEWVPFHSIKLSYRNINVKDDFLYSGWLRFIAFRSNRVLFFCEQVFIVAILYSIDHPALLHRWALVHPKSSKLLNSEQYIGLFGISDVNMSVRKEVNKIVGNLCWENKNYFGPASPSWPTVQQLVSKTITVEQDHFNLEDLFLKYFVPYLNDLNDRGKVKWSKKHVFTDNELLLNGKIYGLVYNVSTVSDVNITDDDPIHRLLLSETRYMSVKHFTGNRLGEIFIPLIPTIDESTNEICGFTYTKYYSNNSVIKLPDIEKHKILVLHVYNFMLSYFLHMDYLVLISDLIRDENDKFVIRNFPNDVTYSATSDDDWHNSEWISVKLSNRNLCPLPLIIWVLYHHTLQYTCGVPLHPQIFFNNRLKIDRYGIYSMRGVSVDRHLPSNSKLADHNHLSTKLMSSVYHGLYKNLSTAHNSDFIESSIVECAEQTRSLLEKNIVKFDVPDEDSNGSDNGFDDGHPDDDDDSSNSVIINSNDDVEEILTLTSEIISTFSQPDNNKSVTNAYSIPQIYAQKYVNTEEAALFKQFVAAAAVIHDGFEHVPRLKRLFYGEIRKRLNEFYQEKNYQKRVTDNQVKTMYNSTYNGMIIRDVSGWTPAEDKSIKESIVMKLSPSETGEKLKVDMKSIGSSEYLDGKYRNAKQIEGRKQQFEAEKSGKVNSHAKTKKKRQSEDLITREETVIEKSKKKKRVKIIDVENIDDSSEDQVDNPV